MEIHLEKKYSSDLLRLTFQPRPYIRDLWSFSAAMTATNSSGQKLNGSPTEAQNKGPVANKTALLY